METKPILAFLEHFLLSCAIIGAPSFLVVLFMWVGTTDFDGRELPRIGQVAKWLFWLALTGAIVSGIAYVWVS